MTNKHNGGAAFPNSGYAVSSGEYVYPSSGMTLRDYFAGQALAGLIASPEHTLHEATVLAGAAYIAADAMLAERGKPRNPKPAL